MTRRWMRRRTPRKNLGFFRGALRGKGSWMTFSTGRWTGIPSPASFRQERLHLRPHVVVDQPRRRRTRAMPGPQTPVRGSGDDRRTAASRAPSRSAPPRIDPSRRVYHGPPGGRPRGPQRRSTPPPDRGDGGTKESPAGAKPGPSDGDRRRSIGSWPRRHPPGRPCLHSPLPPSAEAPGSTPRMHRAHGCSRFRMIRMSLAELGFDSNAVGRSPLPPSGKQIFNVSPFNA